MKARLHVIRSGNAKANELPSVAFIPGGPGLSSATLRSMELLQRSFHLIFVDPPGTGGSAPLVDPTLENVLGGIKTALRGHGRPIILAGHSFGGVYAAELAAQAELPIRGLACIATALSERALGSSEDGYAKERSKNPLLAEAEGQWRKSQTSAAFSDWLANYGSLFFRSDKCEEGRKLLASDLSCAETFMRVRPAWLSGAHLIAPLSKLLVPKLLIAGEKDHLYRQELLRCDAESFGLKFICVKNAAHFVTLDGPETVATLIEEYFGDSKEAKS